MVRSLAILCCLSLLLGMVFFCTMPTLARFSDRCSDTPGVTPTPVTNPETIPTGALLLNELLFNPEQIWNCSYPQQKTAQYQAWIEIFNTLDYPLDLYQASASIDTENNKDVFAITFHFNDIVPPHGFLTIFPFVASQYYPQYTTNLRLRINGEVVDSVSSIPALPTDTSYARTMDGGPNWGIVEKPTIATSNNPPATTTAPATKMATPTAHSHTKPTVQPTPRKTATAKSTAQKATPSVTYTGTQPAWDTLHFPNSPPYTPTVQPTPTSAHMNTPLPTPGADNIGQKIVLTLVIVALVATLFWLWRHFSTT